jgi:hypothetical protein
VEEVKLNNYLIKFNDKRVVDNIKLIVDKVRYSGKFINIIFVSATEEVVKEMAKWKEVDSVELEDTEILFQ